MKYMKKTIKTALIILCAILCLTAVLSSCSTAGKYDPSVTGKGTKIDMDKVKKEINSKKVEDFVAADGKTDYVLIKVKNYGDIVVVLREDVAPVTVKNFKKLVDKGFYSNLIFHRVMEGFMIQGGGITTDYTEKEASSIYGEFTSNGHTNKLLHVRGVISMARTSVPDSASSQFFIMHADNSGLNGDYASFGYVLAGMDVVDKIATCKVEGSANSPKPVEQVVIESITFVQPK